MDNDLDRSVRLIEDVLSTSGRGLLKKKFTSKQDRNRNCNISVTLAPHELTKFLNDQSSIYDETITTILQTEKSITGNLLQANNTPWKTAVDSLYREFFTVLKNHSGCHDILETVTDLARCCSDTLKIVQGLRSKVAISTVDEEVWLRNECNTWRLLYILYQDRFFTRNNQEEELLQYFGSSEKLCVKNLFKRDSLVRESQLILDWLECSAVDKEDEILHFSDSSVGWENTLHQLQFSETIAFSSSRQIVSQMDPDAPHHEKKPLHDLDMEDEKRLSKKIFAEIRCGKLEEAEKLCRQCGHSWRAALFEGWRLFHDPNIKEKNYDENAEIDDGYQEMVSNELEEIEGNSNRDIWKNVAIKYCKQDYFNPYDKAAIGSFCGFLYPILPVCTSWEDNLWAYMRTIVDIRVESEIRDCCVRNKKYIPLPEEYWAQRMSLNEIFINLESSKHSTVREESRRWEHIIQKYIILDEIPTLLQELDEWTDDANITTHYVRFIAHLVLFLDHVGQAHNRDIIEKILEVYIKRLMDLNEAELIPFYISKINTNAQIHLYPQYLEKIIHAEERKMSLKYAEENGLNVLSITKQVVQNIRNIPFEIDTSRNLQQKITDLDHYKISALDWLNFYDNQRADVLIQANALIFSFLTLGKLDAAQLAFNKVAVDSVEKILSEGDVNEELKQAIKDHFSYKAYLDANEAFNEWFKQYKSKPVIPDEVPENAPFPEKVAYQHRISQYKAELERWKLTTNHLSKNAKILLYNVLLFPEGWLIGAKDADYLRSSCIPEVVLLLYSVLSESEQYEECVQLADIIASEKHCIYKVYAKEKLAEILIKLCESSVTLLNSKKDPWGNDTSA